MQSLLPSDRVALLLPGSASYVDRVLDLLSAGIVPVPLDPKLMPAERQRVLVDVDPAVVVTTADQLRGVITPAEKWLPLARPMFVTSGTTGRPKGVWSGQWTVDQATAAVEEERQVWGFSGDDVNLVLSPLHHSAPLRFAMGTRLAGGRVVVPGPFDPTLTTTAIEQERPTTMFCVPSHLQRLFAHWDEVGVPDLSSFRLVAHAGAPCPDHVKRRLIELFPDGSTWEFYGATEGRFTVCPSSAWLERPGTLGLPQPGRVMSVDADGVLWCEVPDHARFEYFRAPEKTAAAWRGNAFTVGDLGRIDADGYVYLDGRREDLIISGGVNVYPAEVENVMAAMTGVEDIVVFALPDEHWGQRVCAAYVGSAEGAQLDAYAREQLAPAKRPKEYHRLEALPRTPTGKVRRLDLPDLLET